MRVARGAEIEGFLLRRYKRFLAELELLDGRKLTVHCPNPGSMRGLLVEGAPVRCSTSDNPAYGETLRRAVLRGAEVLAVGARVTKSAIVPTRALRVEL